MRIVLVFFIVMFVVQCTTISCKKSAGTPPVVDSDELFIQMYCTNKTDQFSLYMNGRLIKADSAFFNLEETGMGFRKTSLYVYLPSSAHANSKKEFCEASGCLELRDPDYKTKKNTRHPMLHFGNAAQCSAVPTGGITYGVTIFTTNVSDKFISGYFFGPWRYGSFNKVPIR